MQQENFTRKCWLVPKCLFQNLDGSMGFHPDWSRDPQQKFPLDLTYQQESWRLECLRRLLEAFKLPSNPTVPVSHKTAEKFTFTEQPERSQSCWVCGIWAKIYYLGAIQDGSMFFKKLCLPETEALSSAQTYCLHSDAENGQWLSNGLQSLGKALQR